jgi:hypothetical protein
MRMEYQREAENCRRQALEFAGRREAAFLLQVARTFDLLARQGPEPTGHNEAAGTR